ncbi:MAG: hypothetical protein OEL76_10705 [Siculibacillus sp.]|nr:hypothetical protein [Siculibacillus sp.]
MTDFVERATLQLIDQSSAAAAKINSEMVKLAATAKRTAAAFASIKSPALGTAIEQARRLSGELSKINSKAVAPRVDAASIVAAAGAAAKLHAALVKAGAVKISPVQVAKAATQPAPKATTARPQVITPRLPTVGPVAEIPPTIGTARIEDAARRLAAMRRQQALALAAEEARAAKIAEREQVQAARRVAAEEARAVRAAAAEQRRVDREAKTAARDAARDARDRSRAALAAAREQAVELRRSEVQAARTARDSARAAKIADEASIGHKIGSAFADTARAAAYEIGRRIGRGVLEAGKEGYKAAETSDARLRLLDVTPAKRAQAEVEAAKIAASSRTSISRGEAGGLIAETLPMTRGDVAAAADLAQVMAEQAATLQTLGASAKDANNQMILIAKAAEQTGQVFDEHGKLDVGALKQAFANYTQAMIQGGREISPREWFTFAKNAGAAKYALSDEGRLAAAQLIETLGAAKTGTGLNQLVKQLQGYNVTKEVLANQAKFGLVTTKEVPAGTTAGTKRTKLVRDESTLGKEFFENPVQVAAARLTEIMKREGLDPKSDEDIQKIARAVTSDRTATNILIAAIKEQAQITSAVNAAKARNVSPDKVAADNAQSGQLAFNKASEATKSAAGAAMQSLNDAAIPALRAYANVANKAGEFFKQPGGEDRPGRALGAGALVGAGVVGAKAMIDWAGPLNVSAVALGGSATALTSAAAALSAAARVQTAGGATGKAGAAGATGAAVASQAAAKPGLLATTGKVATRGLGGFAISGAGDLAGDLVGGVQGALIKLGSDAVAGAMVGSAFGPWGAAIGAVVGAGASLALRDEVMQAAKDATKSLTGVDLPKAITDFATGEKDKIGGNGRDPELDRLIEYEKRAFADLTRAADQRASALTEEARRSADGALAAAEGRLAGITQALADRRETLASDAAEKSRFTGAEGFNPREEGADRASRRRLEAALAFDEQDGADRAALRAARAGTLAAEQKIAEGKARAADAVARFAADYEARRKAIGREKVDEAVRAAKANAERVNAERQKSTAGGIAEEEAARLRARASEAAAEAGREVSRARALGNLSGGFETGGSFGGDLAEQFKSTIEGGADRFSSVFGEGIGRLEGAGESFRSGASSGAELIAGAGRDAASAIASALRTPITIQTPGAAPAAPKAANTGTLAPQ